MSYNLNYTTFTVFIFVPYTQTLPPFALVFCAFCHCPRLAHTSNGGLLCILSTVPGVRIDCGPLRGCFRFLLRLLPVFCIGHLHTCKQVAYSKQVYSKSLASAKFGPPLSCNPAAYSPQGMQAHKEGFSRWLSRPFLLWRVSCPSAAFYPLNVFLYTPCT